LKADHFLRIERDTVPFGVTGRPRAWKLRSNMLSPRYTTEWGEDRRRAECSLDTPLNV
jgi:hypothetical protein